MIIHMIKRKPDYMFPKPTLVPYSENDSEQYSKLKYNTVYRVNIKQPRNYKHHSKYFALCRMICDNTEYFTSEKQVSEYLKLKTGHIESFVIGNETIIIPKSINFDTLAQDEFEKYYDACLPIIAELLGCTVHEIQENEIFYL